MLPALAWWLCSNSSKRHAGTSDVDVQVNLEIAGGSVQAARLEQALLNAGSGEPSLISVEEFSAMIAEDYVRYGKVIKDTGIKVDN